MGDKGHFLISLSKSLIRIIGCCVAYYCVAAAEDIVRGVISIAISFTIAEILGIVEEVVDKR